MFYAHLGNSTDNAFTTLNGYPIRKFIVFRTKKEREEFRNFIWKNSAHEKNLIDCSSKLVYTYYDKKTCYIDSQGFVRHEHEQRYE